MGRGKKPDNLEEILPELTERFNAGEEIGVLEQEFKIPRATIYHYMKLQGIHRERKTTVPRAHKVSGPEDIVLKSEAEELASEATKIATIAIGVGSPIARRYTPLVDSMLSEGKPFDAIAEEIMTWFERKTAINTELDELKQQVASLRQDLSRAYGMLAPNFKYILKVRTLEKYALQALRCRAAGIRIPVKAIIKAFNNDLNAIDDDLRSALEVKVN